MYLLPPRLTSFNSSSLLIKNKNQTVISLPKPRLLFKMILLIDLVFALVGCVHGQWSVFTERLPISSSFPPCLSLLRYFLPHQFLPFSPQPFSRAIPEDNGTHKSSAGQWSLWNWCAFISKQWRCLMRGFLWCHNFKQLTGPGRCVLAPRMGSGPVKTQLGQLNQWAHEERWQSCGVSNHQTHSITFLCTKPAVSCWFETQPSLSPPWVD